LEADNGLYAVTVYFPERHHLHLVPGELPSQKQMNDGGLVIPVSLYGEFSVDVSNNTLFTDFSFKSSEFLPMSPFKLSFNVRHM
jgi:hypothetical protein